MDTPPDTHIVEQSSSWTIRARNSSDPTARPYIYRRSYSEPDPQHQELANNNNGTQHNAFEARVNAFARNPTTQKMLNELHANSVTELRRRNAERQARKQQNSDEAIPEVTISDERTKCHFSESTLLSSADQKAWQASMRADVKPTYPHLWLRLASIFSVQSKTWRQPSLLSSAAEKAATLDRGPGIHTENYLIIRDTQNRNYAREAVSEGIKLKDQNRLREAMEHYKRALDMDPKYAEGWFRVAEGLLQEHKKAEAIEQLQRALHNDPNHAAAKTLLCNIKNTTSSLASSTHTMTDALPAKENEKEKSVEDERNKRKNGRRHHEKRDERKRRHRRRSSSSRRDSSRRESKSSRSSRRWDDDEEDRGRSRRKRRADEDGDSDSVHRKRSRSYVDDDKGSRDKSRESTRHGRAERRSEQDDYSNTKKPEKDVMDIDHGEKQDAPSDEKDDRSLDEEKRHRSRSKRERDGSRRDRDSDSHARERKSRDKDGYSRRRGRDDNGKHARDDDRDSKSRYRKSRDGDHDDTHHRTSRDKGDSSRNKRSRDNDDDDRGRRSRRDNDGDDDVDSQKRSRRSRDDRSPGHHRHHSSRHRSKSPSKHSYRSSRVSRH